VRCVACGLREWRPLAETIPGPVCHGCGSVISEPFGPDAAHFQYRASEVLLRLLIETDVLPHLLTARFLWYLLHPGVDRDGVVYGIYPGVEFFQPDTLEVIGEADVVLLLADGGLVLVECKSSARGLNLDELGKLWSLADAVGAKLTFAATLDSSIKATEIWRDTGGRWHRSLTAEHLYEAYPSAVVGDDPFAWRTEYRAPVRRVATVDELHESFLERLRENEVDRNSWSRPSWRRED
jgi:hypothetical protein